MKSTTLAAALAAAATIGGAPARLPAAPVSADPVVRWSLEAQRAIVPPPAGVGNKFPGEAAVYMGIVHAAIYDAAVAIEGGYQPYAIEIAAPAGTSPEAAVAAAAHGVLVGLLPAQQADLDARYAAYLAGIPEGDAKANGIAVGATVAEAMLALREGDGRDENPQYVQPPPGPGVFEPEPGRPVLGLRLSRIRPLALGSPWSVRPDGPEPLPSPEYAADFEQVKDLGRFDSPARTAAQTETALFWTDHDLRQWNEAMLRIGQGHGLGLVETARMLAMAHVSGGDAMIGCFDAKFHFMAWRPSFAIPRADTDSNPATEPDTAWRPLRPTPNFPEYPSAHACHSSAMAEALGAFFGTDHVPFTLDSRVTGTTRAYGRFREAVRDVNQARVLAGFHFRNSDQEGSNLGRTVARVVADGFFQPARSLAPTAPSLTEEHVSARMFERPFYFLSPWTERFLLHESGDFELRFMGPGNPYLFEGRYELSGSSYIFIFEHGPNPLEWRADATLDAGFLDVRYNDVMKDKGFFDGVYREVTPGLPGLVGDAQAAASR